MHKVSWENRTQSIKRVAEQISDSEIIFKVTSEDFVENAVHDIRHTLPLLTLNNYSITKVFRQLLLKPIRCSKMLHLEIPNITKAVAKHLPVSKTCQHVPTLNPHV
jgi:hypothetical protein